MENYSIIVTQQSSLRQRVIYFDSCSKRSKKWQGWETTDAD